MFVVGDHGASKWQREEADLLILEVERRPEFEVVPVVLPGTKKDPDFPHSYAIALGWTSGVRILILWRN